MVDLTQLGKNIATGAAAGSIVPGLGTALGAVGGVALTLAPEVGRWLFGPGSDDAVKAVQVAVEEATGTADQAMQMAALSDPETAAKLRLALASIAAEQAQAADQAQTAQIAAVLGDIQNARATMVQLTQSKSPMAWGAAVVSVVVLTTFFVAMALALTHNISDNAAPVLNVLLGSLTAMATSVVSYWVGSSIGSYRKDTNNFLNSSLNK